MKYLYLFFITVLGSAFLLDSENEVVVVEEDLVTCTCDREADSLVLVELYDSTTLISDWQNPWDFSLSMNNWEGVLLNGEGCVISLIGGDTWNGVLPDAIGDLCFLEVLKIEGDELGGNIPSSIGNLDSLVELYFEYNCTGNIPDEIFTLINLKRLEIISEEIDGIISEDLGNLINLERLIIKGTVQKKSPLNGHIPFSIGNLQNLIFLSIRNNNVSGNIPSSIGNLTNLVNISITRTLINGSIPDILHNLINLNTLLLSNNFLTGSIPNSIGSLSQLTNLYLDSNNFSGSLPLSFVNLSNLSTCKLHENNFDGPLPDSIGLLQNLERFEISNNNFSGEMPNSLIEIPNLHRFEADGNNFTGNVPLLFQNLLSVSRFNIENNKLENLPTFSNSLNWGTGFNSGIILNNNSFTFEDILPNLSAIHTNYSLQDSVYYDTIITINYHDSLIIDLEVDEGILSNNYSWFRNGLSFIEVEGNTKLVIPNFTPDKVGVYTCEITNDSILPTDLTLHSRNISVEIIIPPTIGDSLELVKFYNATNGDEWIESWNLDTSIDYWSFVKRSDNGRVTSLIINGENNLTGVLVDLNLPQLDSLVITGNVNLQSEIPSFLNLSNLKILDLRSNGLHDSIPLFSNMPFLKKVYLSNNIGLNGNLHGFSNNSNLENLYIDSCNLSGIIPDFENCPILKYLSLSHNNFNSIPYTFNLDGLAWLNLSHNNIEFTFPTINSSVLAFLYLNDNEFYGEIPDLNNFVGLRFIDISNNFFSGKVPDVTELGIYFFKMNNNNFNELYDLSQINTWSNCNINPIYNCGLEIQNNNFSFDDIIPNLSVSVDGSYIYSPQDSFYQKTELYLTTNETYTINLEIDESITTNKYEWFRNGTPWETTNENKLLLNDLSTFDMDTFTCIVANPQVSDLILYSRPTIIHICEPSESIISQTLCDGDSLIVNGTIYNQDLPEGTEYINVPDEEGCDSIIQVMLDFIPKSEKIITETLSEGGFINIEGTRYDSTGIYEIVLSGQATSGCDSIILLTLTINPKQQILNATFPNAFTPNGDQLNDYFVIPALRDNPQDFPENEFIVFNRLGKVLYHSKPYNNDWEGTANNGEELPTGTYYYSFRYQGGEPKEGKLLLNR